MHIEHGAMVQGKNAASLLEQVQTGRWLDLLQGPDTAVLLAPDGQLTTVPAQ